MYFFRFITVATLLTVPQSAFSQLAPKPVNESTVGSPTETPIKGIEDVAAIVKESVEDSRFYRRITDYFVLVSYSPFDILLPSKWGLTLGLKKDGSHSIELEYLRGYYSIPFVVKNLGSMTDDRISLIARSYGKENSLNMSYGVTYFEYSLRLGNQLLQSVNQSYPSVDMVKIQSLGFNLGVGNRWIIDKNITFGVDWISWSQPVITLNRQDAFLDHSNNSDDRDTVSDLLRVVSYFPRFAAIKLQLGMSF